MIFHGNYWVSLKIFRNFHLIGLLRCLKGAIKNKRLSKFPSNPTALSTCCSSQPSSNTSLSLRNRDCEYNNIRKFEPESLKSSFRDRSFVIDKYCSFHEVLQCITIRSTHVNDIPENFNFVVSTFYWKLRWNKQSFDFSQTPVSVYHGHGWDGLLSSREHFERKFCWCCTQALLPNNR